MHRILVVVSLLLAPSFALAQPEEPPAPPAAPPAPPAPPAPEPAPPAPAPAPASPHETCLLRRQEIETAANRTSDLDERTRLLQSLPDCSKPEVVLPPAPPTCGPGQQLVQGECTGGSESARGSTSEFSIGMAWLSNGFGGGSSIVHGVGGLNLGVGKFVNHDLALSLRMSGITWLDGGLIYIGMIGPNVQAWLGNGWVGGGIGVGVVAGCADSCDATTTSGFDLRGGHQLGEHANVSVELMSVGGFFSTGSLQTVSVLFGYQSF